MDTKSINLIDEIIYQDGTIISKVLLKKKNGNITLFAFDKEQELSEHISSHDAIIQVLEGDAEITIEGNPFQLNAGRALMLPAGIPHAVKAIEKMKIILIMIKD